MEYLWSIAEVPLGSIGDIGVLSFHETKNIISGEGGALLVNNHKLCGRAEIIREKGTNRSKFFRGQVDKYTWVDIGSSYLPGEVIAAFLWAQLEEEEYITSRRLALWNNYHENFKNLENIGVLKRPIIPDDCLHNGHMYYLVLPSLHKRDKLIQKMNKYSIGCVFHYVPLHSSPAGRLYGRVYGKLNTTEEMSDRLVRIPFWIDLSESAKKDIVNLLSDSIASL